MSFSMAMCCLFFGSWAYADIAVGKRGFIGPAAAPVDLSKPLPAPQTPAQAVHAPALPFASKPIPNPGIVKVIPFAVTGTGYIAPSPPPVAAVRVVRVAPFSVTGAGYVAPKSSSPAIRVVNVTAFQVFGTH